MITGMIIRTDKCKVNTWFQVLKMFGHSHFYYSDHRSITGTLFTEKVYHETD